MVIRVGDDTYTKAQVQAQIQNQVNYMTALYSRYGLSFDSTNADVMNSLTDNVLNSLVERSVLLAKAKELGLDQLTDEEKTKIEENTASQLDSLRKSAANEFSLDLETQLEEINAKLDELGYTEEVVRKGMTESLLITKAEDYAVKDVTVTEDEIVADFNSKVEAAKTSYESDLSAYGKAVLNGTTVYYRPAGYRNVKQILIQVQRRRFRAGVQYPDRAGQRDYRAEQRRQRDGEAGRGEHGRAGESGHCDAQARHRNAHRDRGG